MIIGTLEIMRSDYVYTLNFNQLYYIHNTYMLINKYYVYNNTK